MQRSPEHAYKAPGRGCSVIVFVGELYQELQGVPVVTELPLVKNGMNITKAILFVTNIVA